MAQASLNFDPTVTPQAALPLWPDNMPFAAQDDTRKIAASIGRDHAEHALRPPVDLLLAEPALRRGWESGRLAYAGRHRSATPQVRLWLALRLQDVLALQAGDLIPLNKRFDAVLDLTVDGIPRYQGYVALNANNKRVFQMVAPRQEA